MIFGKVAVAEEKERGREREERKSNRQPKFGGGRGKSVEERVARALYHVAHRETHFM